MPIANASLLDEGTAAAEAMAMLFNNKNKNHHQITAPKFFIDEKIFKQTKDILITRAKPVGIETVFGKADSIKFDESFPFDQPIDYVPAAVGTMDGAELRGGNL